MDKFINSYVKIYNWILYITAKLLCDNVIFKSTIQIKYNWMELNWMKWSDLPNDITSILKAHNKSGHTVTGSQSKRMWVCESVNKQETGSQVKQQKSVHPIIKRSRLNQREFHQPGWGKWGKVSKINYAFWKEGWHSLSPLSVIVTKANHGHLYAEGGRLCFIRVS